MRPRQPPAIVTCPELNLVERWPRDGASSSTAGAIVPAAATGAPDGIPIATTRSSPLCHLPGATRCPSLAAWKLTVRSASTATPAISPLEASTPEAMSQATTGAGQRLIAAIAVAAGSRGSPAKPVPKIASTTTPEPANQASRSSGASPEKSRAVSTAKPSSASWAAAIRPSPPLLPLPQRTRTGPRGESAATASARAVPAASISRAEGTPCSSIAQASTARMPSAS